MLRDDIPGGSRRKHSFRPRCDRRPLVFLMACVGGCCWEEMLCFGSQERGLERGVRMPVCRILYIHACHAGPVWRFSVLQHLDNTQRCKRLVGRKGSTFCWAHNAHYNVLIGGTWPVPYGRTILVIDRVWTAHARRESSTMISFQGWRSMLAAPRATLSTYLGKVLPRQVRLLFPLHLLPTNIFVDLHLGHAAVLVSRLCSFPLHMTPHEDVNLHAHH